MTSSSNANAMIDSSNASNDTDNEISNSNNSSVDSISQLKSYIEDDGKVCPADRHSCAIGIVLGCINNFTNSTLKEEPFSFGKRSKTKVVKKFLV